MKTKTYIIVLSLLINSLFLRSQGIVLVGDVQFELQGKADLVVSNKGDIVFEESDGRAGTYELSGDIYLSGEWVNDLSTLLDLSADGGSIIFSGTRNQSIEGASSTRFSSIILQNDVVLNRDASLSDNLDFTSGSLLLSNSTLTLLDGSSLSNYDASNNVITNGTGDLKQYVEAGGSQVVFPVATETSYTPVFITQNSGTSGYYNVRLMDGVWSEGTTGANLALVEPAVNRTWIIDADVTPDAEIQLQWNASDEVNNFDRDAALGAEYDNGWLQHITSISGSDPYVVTFSNVEELNNDQPHSLSDQNDPLEIELLYFNAHWANQKRILRWASITEFNSRNYELWSSTDMEHWQFLGTVSCSGISNQVKEYVFEDTKTYENDVVYYKLDEINMEGVRSTLAKTTLQSGSEELISQVYLDGQNLYLLGIQESQGNYQVRIYNMMGQEVINQDFSLSNHTRIDVSGLSVGVYVLQITQLHTGKSEQIKIQKTH